MFGELFLTQQHPWNSFPALERPSWGLQGPVYTVEAWLLSPAVVLHVSTLTWAQAHSGPAFCPASGRRHPEMCWEIKGWQCPDTQRLSEAFLIEMITCLYSKETFEAVKKNLSAIAFCFFFSLSKAWQQVHVCMCVFVHICVCVCIYIHVCMCVQIYVYL